ncbi:MAG: hypothetical protein Q8R20_02850 [Nanoarchaeota archaeon]|nr:hypothetical protein [Nanoarchaeota archaeon]
MKQKILSILSVRKELLTRRVSLFTTQEFQRIFRSSYSQTKYFLETYAKQGMFVRLKPGLYAFEGRMPSGEEIANALYQPSYLSFEYALARHGIIPEIVYALTSATTKSTRTFATADLGFEYFKIKKQAFIGYGLVQDGRDRTRSVLMAEPEKAVADYLYFVSLGKRQMNDRMIIKGLDRKKITRYAKLFRRPGLMQIIQNL